MTRYYPRHRRSRNTLRKESRTIPMRGYGDDEDRWYRCWNCNHPCDVERDERGKTLGTRGVPAIDEIYLSGTQVLDSSGSEDYSIPDVDYRTNKEKRLATRITLSGIPHEHIVMENDASGSPKGVYHYFRSNVTRGCPFCGTLNWRGDY